jgi:hypothetical protein
MKKILFATFTLGFSFATARADQVPIAPNQSASTAAAPAPEAPKTPSPSRESVMRLVDALGYKQNYENLFFKRVDTMIGMQLMRSTMGIAQTPEIKADVEAAHAKFMNKIKTNLGWEKVEQVYVDEISKDFTQEEVDGLVSFYESSLGKAFAAKEPSIMQDSNKQIGALIQPVMREVMMEVNKTETELRSKGQPMGGNAPMPGGPPMMMRPSPGVPPGMPPALPPPAGGASQTAH